MRAVSTEPEVPEMLGRLAVGMELRETNSSSACGPDWLRGREEHGVSSGHRAIRDEKTHVLGSPLNTRCYGSS